MIRQHSAQEIIDEPVSHWELFRLSLRDTRWWLGGAAAVGNYTLQAAALAQGEAAAMEAHSASATTPAAEPLAP